MIQKGFWDFRIWKIGEKIEKFEGPLLKVHYREKIQV